MDKLPGHMEAAVVNEDIVSLNVHNLSFLPDKKLVKKYLELARYKLTLLNMDWLIPFYKGEHRKLMSLGSPLYNVNFKALSGEVTGIVGDEVERREIIHLIAGREKGGKFDGNIFLGGGAEKAPYYYDNVTFVQRVRCLFCASVLLYIDLYI
jgi:hypothetical protein